MIFDHYYEKWIQHPQIPIHPYPQPYYPYDPHQPPTQQLPPYIQIPSPITPQEIEEFRKLLDRAREYDKRNGEPDCELQSKKDKLLDLAEQLGVKIDFL